MNNPVSPTPSLSQASGSNPEPVVPVAAELAPSNSLAPGFGLTSRPSSSDSKQEELRRATTLSIGENTNEHASACGSKRVL